MLPFILFFIAIEWTMPALALFIFVSLLDKLDGYIARKLKQATGFGRGFDAAVDSTTIFLVFVFLAIFEYIPWSYFAVIVFFGFLTFLMQAYFTTRTKKALRTNIAILATLLTYVFIITALLKLYIVKFYIDLVFVLAAAFSFARCMQYGLRFARLIRKRK